MLEWTVNFEQFSLARHLPFGDTAQLPINDWLQGAE
jgi:hypothetical protein